MSGMLKLCSTPLSVKIVRDQDQALVLYIKYIKIYIFTLYNLIVINIVTLFQIEYFFSGRSTLAFNFLSTSIKELFFPIPPLQKRISSIFMSFRKVNSLPTLACWKSKKATPDNQKKSKIPMFVTAYGPKPRRKNWSIKKLKKDFSTITRSPNKTSIFSLRKMNLRSLSIA